MPKIYLLGGENIWRRDAQEVNQQAFNDAGGSPNVLVFSWARASFDKAYNRQKTLFDYFRFLGAKKVSMLDYSCKTDEIKEKVSESDLVYLTGGVPSVLVERLRKKGVDSLLGGFEGVIVGRSAGALALCRKCVITFRRTYSVKVIDGLGLVNLTLKAHYVEARAKELMLLSEQEKVFAVPKGSAIVYHNGNLSFVNSVYLFQNGAKQTLT
ncbi:Type 1 glutamine amidotransferase-like domain-containing protein [Candidatus Bathyarchaeota archaeon]|nr:Type 1 glutamine amidotransferase-like domain-containing protein [Candidatus Bathyarchaeota archaeon]